jgi:hypothetical protein
MAVEVNQEELLEGYKTAAAGAAKLAQSIDLLLPGLIAIASGRGAPDEKGKTSELSAKELRDIANETLAEFEESRGQKLNRQRYLQGRARHREVAEGEALHKARSG